VQIFDCFIVHKTSKLIYLIYKDNDNPLKLFYVCIMTGGLSETHRTALVSALLSYYTLKTGETALKTTVK